MPGATVLEGALEGFSRTRFTARGKTRDIYRTGAGPAVIVMSEIPGITPLVASFARRVAAIGCTAVLPQLFGIPGGRAHTEAHGADCCRRVHLAGALAMMVEEVVLAPVLSQPALPFPLTRTRRRDLGIGDEDLARVRERCGAGDVCVLGLRFTGDKAVPPERFARLREELGDAFVAVEIDSRPGNPEGYRKVLTEDLRDVGNSATRASLEQVLDLFRSKLLS